MLRWRITLCVAGAILGLFGVYRLVTQIPNPALFDLGKWLIGAVVIHDGILSPLVVAVGWLIARTVPPRSRRYVQGAAITAALVTVIAIPMIYREHTQVTSKVILEQDYVGNLTVLLSIIAAVSVVAYAWRVLMDRRTRGHGTGQQTAGPASSGTELSGEQ